MEHVSYFVAHMLIKATPMTTSIDSGYSVVIVTWTHLKFMLVYGFKVDTLPLDKLKTKESNPKRTINKSNHICRDVCTHLSLIFLLYYSMMELFILLLLSTDATDAEFGLLLLHTALLIIAVLWACYLTKNEKWFIQ